MPPLRAIRFFLTIALTLSHVHSIAAYCENDWIMVKTFPLTPNTELAIGEPIKILKREGKSVLIENANVWVPANYVLSVKRFRPVTQWPYKKKLVAGNGDYDATYIVNRDGTFVVKESEFNPKDETYKYVPRKGQFYSVRNLYWAKINNQCVYADRIFVNSHVKGICWQGYMGLGYNDIHTCP